MIDFKELMEKIGDDKTDLKDDAIDEGFLRNASTAVLFTRIFNLSKRVKGSKDVSKKLDLTASKNTHLARVGKFLEKSNR